jgi:hypothetical protein
MGTANDQLLRAALRTDAIACAIFAVGALWILLDNGSWLAQLDVSPRLLIAAGLIAVVGVPLLWSLSRRSEIAKARIWSVIASNLAWAVFCIVALTIGWIHPSKNGSIVIVSQAVITAAIAELEWRGLRSASASNLRSGKPT